MANEIVNSQTSRIFCDQKETFLSKLSRSTECDPSLVSHSHRSRDFEGLRHPRLLAHRRVLAPDEKVRECRKNNKKAIRKKEA